jgi:6-phosphogluconolactonase
VSPPPGAGPPGEPEVVVLADADAVAAEAAARVVAGLATAIAARGVAHLVTTGGSTPEGIHAALRTEPLRDAVDWSKVHLWVGDERFVRRTDPRSNMGAAEQTLLGLGGVPIPADQVHGWPTDDAIDLGLGPGLAARRMAELGAGRAPDWATGRPTFDVVIVGIGPDGHLLSIFPGSRAFDDPALTLAIPAPTHIEPHVERVTFGPPILDGARVLLAPAFGAAKAEVLGRVFGEDRDPTRWPAQLARRPGATWLLDSAAAKGLGG